jgi:hypothetical protein
MYQLLIAVTAAALLAAGCGRRGSSGSSSSKKEKEKEVATTGIGGGGTSTVGGGTTDGGGRTKSTVDTPPSLPDKNITPGELGFVLTKWETVRNTMGKDKPNFKATDLPLEAWAGALPRLDQKFEEVLGTNEARQFLTLYPRVSKLYRCTVGLPPENDITREERDRAETEANSVDGSAQEKSDARKRVGELLRKSWENAAGGFDGLKPTTVEFEAMRGAAQRLHAMFKGRAEVED